MKNILRAQGHKFEVTRKDIKNIYLRVHSGNDKIAISAPKHISDETIRLFILSKLDWIKKKSKELPQQALKTSQRYVDGEIFHIWGRKYSLSISEENISPFVNLKENNLQLVVKPNTGYDNKKQLLNKWSREQLRLQANPLIEKWQPIIGVSINKLYVRQMKSCWGSCNTHKETIRLNTALIKKPIECLEYVVVHELVHLLEPSHNKNFHGLMTRFLPDWKARKKLLNNLLP